MTISWDDYQAVRAFIEREMEQRESGGGEAYLREAQLAFKAVERIGAAMIAAEAKEAAHERA